VENPKQVRFELGKASVPIRLRSSHIDADTRGGLTEEYPHMPSRSSRSESVIAQTGYESPPPPPPQSQPSTARSSLQTDELKPYVRECSDYRTSGSEWDYIDTEIERRSEDPRSRTPILLPEKSRQRGRPAASSPNDLQYGNEPRRRSRNRLGDAKDRQLDYDTIDVQYARKYGPEDIRWVPKNKKDERRYVSKPKPPYSRTATYVY
jgi:hypothetical protein